MKLFPATMAALLVVGAFAMMIPSASAHPVQLLCDQPLGYTALGPSGNLFSLWVASVGTGGTCLDYPFVCFYDSHYEPNCSDARHVGVPFCKSCVKCCDEAASVEGRDMMLLP